MAGARRRRGSWLRRTGDAVFGFLTVHLLRGIRLIDVNTMATLAGCVMSVRKVITKKGDSMCIARLEDLHGPEQGVIVLPRHLAWPGMREFDVTDDRLRRSLYGIVLTQGRRNDLARFVNARLLRQDWPLLRGSLDPKLRRWCERRLLLRDVPMPD